MIALLLLLSLHGYIVLSHPDKGEWHLLLNNTGVVGMHMAVTHLNTVVFYDQTGAGPSNYTLRHNPHGGGSCHHHRRNSHLLPSSCYAHSVEYDVSTNALRSLVHLDSDPWCSSGSFLSSGTLVQTGGYRSGSRSVRYFKPCDGPKRDCDWRHSASNRGRSHHHRLSRGRWYASNALLPEEGDRVIVVGGRDEFSYEFVPRRGPKETKFDLHLLRRAYDRREGGNNLYPFVHLSSDGHLFVFANRDSILLDYNRNRVVKKFPRMPGRGGRNYPATGSSVLLPLSYKDNFTKVEVMICGGAARGAYSAAEEDRRYVKGLSTCGRMVITGNRGHRWRMERMPSPRLLCDMLVLPTGNILIINGAQRGSGGWENADHPALTPFLYAPKKPRGRRFSKLAPTKIPRMYHSSAVLLPDGRVLVAGGNPHERYMFGNVRYPTELRLQAFVPHYMNKRYGHSRPQNVTIISTGRNGTFASNIVRYGEDFNVEFWLRRKPEMVSFSAYAPPFTTHSFGMNQRLLRLRYRKMVREKGGRMTALLEAPPSPNVAPAGYYMLSVVNDGIPSVAQWVRFVHR